MSSSAEASPPVVVLTGGIASGKTTVSDQFSRLGVPVIDTDVLARELVEPGTEGLACIVKVFGEGVLHDDGSLDRAALRSRVFSQPQARERLEAILHPRIEALARERIAAHTATPYCLLVVPLLAETGLFPDADRVVVVDTSEERQIQRLTGRDHVDEDTARRMLQAQASRADRLALADEVISNDGSLDELRDAARQLHQKLLARYAARSTNQEPAPT